MADTENLNNPNQENQPKKMEGQTHSSIRNIVQAFDNAGRFFLENARHIVGVGLTVIALRYMPFEQRVQGQFSTRASFGPIETTIASIVESGLIRNFGGEDNRIGLYVSATAEQNGEINGRGLPADSTIRSVCDALNLKFDLNNSIVTIENLNKQNPSEVVQFEIPSQPEGSTSNGFFLESNGKIQGGVACTSREEDGKVNITIVTKLVTQGAGLGIGFQDK